VSAAVLIVLGFSTRDFSLVGGAMSGAVGSILLFGLAEALGMIRDAAVNSWKALDRLSRQNVPVSACEPEHAQSISVLDDELDSEELASGSTSVACEFCGAVLRSRSERSQNQVNAPSAIMR